MAFEAEVFIQVIFVFNSPCNFLLDKTQSQVKISNGTYHDIDAYSIQSTFHSLSPQDDSVSVLKEMKNIS